MNIQSDTLKYTEKLAKLLFFVACLAIVIIALQYFGNVIGYIVLGLVTALIAKPLMKVLRKIKLKGKSAPDSVLALLSILMITGVFCGIIAVVIPLVTKVASNIASVSSEADISSISRYLAGINNGLKGTFSLPSDFKIEELLVEKLSSILNFNLFGNMLGTVTATLAGTFVALFSMLFISFFLIKDEKLLPKLISAITPERHFEHMSTALEQTEHLLSRYFLGLIIEMSCVGAIDFIGLWTVAQLDFESALGIGFISGLLNIIPYLGPLFGSILGVLMGIVIKFCGPAAAVAGPGFWGFVAIAASVFAFAHLIDNFVFQPLIYSTSVKAHPLEIFIVILVAGSIAGPLGMLVATPFYTVIRVFAFNFHPDSKVVKALMRSR